MDCKTCEYNCRCFFNHEKGEYNSWESTGAGTEYQLTDTCYGWLYKLDCLEKVKEKTNTKPRTGFAPDDIG